jgi:hypothetical protein
VGFYDVQDNSKQFIHSNYNLKTHISRFFRNLISILIPPVQKLNKCEVKSILEPYFCSLNPKQPRSRPLSAWNGFYSVNKCFWVGVLASCRKKGRGSNFRGLTQSRATSRNVLRREDIPLCFGFMLILLGLIGMLGASHYAKKGRGKTLHSATVGMQL